MRVARGCMGNVAAQATVTSSLRDQKRPLSTGGSVCPSVGRFLPPRANDMNFADYSIILVIPPTRKAEWAESHFIEHGQDVGSVARYLGSPS